jgi:hypothetical protein
MAWGRQRARNLRAPLVACVLILAAIQPASGDVSIRERLAEVIATTHFCKNVSLNSKVFNSVARKAGLDPRQGSSDMTRLEQEAKLKIRRLRKFDRRFICLIGETNFGPRGTIVRNALIVHKRTPPITQF